MTNTKPITDYSHNTMTPPPAGEHVKFMDASLIQEINNKFNQLDQLLDTIPGAVPIDNLNSYSATQALSANMGRELKEQIDNLGGDSGVLTGMYEGGSYRLTDLNLTQNLDVEGNTFLDGTLNVEGTTNVRKLHVMGDIFIPRGLQLSEWEIYEDRSEGQGEGVLMFINPWSRRTISFLANGDDIDL